MIKRMMLTGLVASLLLGQPAFAQHKALPDSGSHFRFSVSGFVLQVNTKAPRRTYPNAGIQVLTPGYTVSGKVRPTADGFYLFSVSDTTPAAIALKGQGGDVRIKICLDGVGDKYTCERHTVSGIANSHIIFMTSTTHNGNFGGAAGADAFCQSAAYQAGSILPAGLTFRALLVDANRYPCSSRNGGVSGSCGGIFARNWPLVAGTEYVNPDYSIFNTVNSNRVFDGSSSFLLSEQGTILFSESYWTGIQSILSNAAGNDIVGWAYTDMNSTADNVVYADNLNNCLNFTDDTGDFYGSYGVMGQFPSASGVPLISPSTWGNYAYFNNNQNNALNNVFSSSAFMSPSPGCNELLHVLCVS